MAGKSEDVEKTETFDEAYESFTHFKEYIDDLGRRPDFYKSLEREGEGEYEDPDLIYAVGDPIFIHVYIDDHHITQYHVIEPEFTDDEEELYEEVLDELIAVAYKKPVPEEVTEIGDVLIDLLDEVTAVESGEETGFLDFATSQVHLTQSEYEKIKYYLIRNRVGYHKLQPLFYDPWLEDIHCTGVGTIKTEHKLFGMVYTNIGFEDDEELNSYILDVTERVERPASDANPVVDAMMPDGSRANFIYSREISKEGSSFTLRKFSDTPLSITQITDWGTLSPKLCGYLWLALENGMNLFVCGETASGKTTTLNAISAFIPPDDKVYTVENTPEVTMPHDIWQHLLTRESGKDSDVDYEELLLAALRSRPDYIIVGEIRGEEGSVAFQAMQTGHPVMSTFHAGDPTTMIQRMTGEPINVPITFIDNLNLVLIQQAVSQGGDTLRRALSLTELERYYEPENTIIQREVLSWDPARDEHNFRGMYNSYILEEKIAKMLGYSDTRKIYDKMLYRAKIIKAMIENDIYNYYEVWDMIKKFYHGGEDALPFEVPA
jgi:flagellar protein FlaI